MKPIVLVGIGLAVLLLLAGTTAAAATPVINPFVPATVDLFADILPVLNPFLQNEERFSAHPYWDVSRYSWGYGTPAPGSTGTISQAQALSDMDDHVNSDFDTLSPKITRPLSANQWAAYLSFSYNEGPGSPGASALVDDINSGDDEKLEAHWREYIYADHVVDPVLVGRRDREWALWMS